MTRDERTSLWWGAAVGGGLVLVSAVVFVTGQGGGAFHDTVTVTTDFRTITGLRRGSPVQLAGVVVGEVQAIDFREATYGCDPAAEDRGRHGRGRRDDCDPQLFCAPEGLCAALEPWTEEGTHRRCSVHADCGEADMVCVTKPFRRRYARVFWAGEDGVCAHYETVLQRVRVTMSVQRDKLHLLGEGSRAKVSSNSVLGDQLVEITRGEGAPLPPGGHIHSIPSSFEDMETFRQRVEVVSRKVDARLGAITDAFGSFNDDRTIAGIKDGIAGLSESTADVAHGRGSLGYLFGEAARGDVDDALQTANDTAESVDRFLRRANTRLAEVQVGMQPKIDDARQTMAGIRAKLDNLHDPANTEPLARFLFDERGADAAQLTKDIANLRETAAGWDEGRGTLGGWFASDDLIDKLLKTLGFTARADTLRRLMRRVPVPE